MGNSHCRKNLILEIDQNENVCLSEPDKLVTSRNSISLARVSFAYGENLSSTCNNSHGQLYAAEPIYKTDHRPRCFRGKFNDGMGHCDEGEERRKLLSSPSSCATYNRLKRLLPGRSRCVTQNKFGVTNSVPS